MRRLTRGQLLALISTIERYLRDNPQEEQNVVLAAGLTKLQEEMLRLGPRMHRAKTAVDPNLGNMGHLA